MKKTLFTLAIAAALTLGGCLATENRRVKVRRSVADINTGISIVNSATQPWWAKNTAGVPDDKNPWLKYVRKTEDRWYDPWSQDPLSNYGVEPLSEQIRRLGPPTETKLPLTEREKSEQVRQRVLRLLERKLEEYRARRTQEVY